MKESVPKLATSPSVTIIIPARNEAELIPRTLTSILNQDYIGSTTVILVDDQSTDGTSAVARQTASTVKRNSSIKFQLIRGRELPAGWSGKLWAMECGLRASSEMKPDYILFTDADIHHPGNSLSRLVAEAETESLQLSSVMVHLKISSLWDRLLLPAFIYFFAKLYPFAWINDASKRTAAAAGGCILVRSEALEKAGGLSRISGELIDDCAMAEMIKGQSGNLSASKIKLQLCRDIHSLRSYQSLESTWSMVRRTAFTQLRYSVLLLAGTLVGMILIYVLPPLLTFGPLIYPACFSSWHLTTSWFLGLSAWIMMSLTYRPMVRWYRLPSWWCLTLPVAGFMYAMMTLDSALKTWQKKTGDWKGRTYS